MLQGDKLITSWGKEEIASPPSATQHFNVITTGTQWAFQPFLLLLNQAQLEALLRKHLTRQLTHLKNPYSSTKNRQGSNPDEGNKGISAFLLKCWQMSHIWLVAVIHANTLMSVCWCTTVSLQCTVCISTVDPYYSSAHCLTPVVLITGPARSNCLC